MSKVRVDIFRKANGQVPLMTWFNSQSQETREKAIGLAKQLKEKGHELGMPAAKFLRDDIWELRVIVRRVQHRILYTFAKERVVLLTHGLTKESIVPPEEIDKAIRYTKEYLQNPKKHTHRIYR
jgi:hypothetical protein